MDSTEGESSDLMSQEDDPMKTFTLDLASQNLSEIPKSICKYKVCKSLDLSCNRINSIKKSDFSTYTQLRELKLYSNKIVTLSGLMHLEKLEELQLQFNCISSIGKSFKCNRNLTFLRLDSNKLTEIVIPEICMLAKLTYLDLSSNKLEDISCISVLSSLERLYCTHNVISKLPRMCDLKKLKEIDFSNNRLVHVGSLKSCNRLEVVILDNNKITNLQSVGCLKLLQELKISNNYISDLKHISEQFPCVEILEIAENKIVTLDQIRCLFNLSSTLKELCIYGNPLLNDKVNSDTSITVKNLLLNNTQLHMLDGIVVEKKNDSRSFSSRLMRPMSASHMISERSIKDQMEFSKMQMDELEDKIKLQFDVLKDSLMELPSAGGKQLDRNKEVQRPNSRCNSRARLNEARAFAEKNFHV